LQKKFRSKDLVVIGVNIDNDTKARIQSFVDSKNLDYRMLLRGDGVALRDYHCRAFPTVYWIDRKGKIMARDYGRMGIGELEARAQALLRR